MNIEVRSYGEKDLPRMIEIWNEVVKEGVAFPQEELLNLQTGEEFLTPRHTALWQWIWRRGIFAAYIYCIQIMWDDAVIYAMQAMRSVQKKEGCILVKNWFLTV